MGFTIHCGAERFFLAPDVHIQSPRHSINRAHNHSTQKKLNQGSTLHGRSFHNRKLWSGYRHRDNILFIRAINEDGNVAENGERKGNEDTDFKWNKVGQAFGRGFDRFCHNFQRELKRDTGIDIERVKAKVVNASKDVQVAVEGYKQKSTESVDRLRFQLWPRFLAWNQWELWKDFKRWESKRIGALVLYVLVVAFSFRGLYLVFKTSRVDRQTTNRLANAYMEAFIPDPSPSNVRKLKKGLWRSYMPERLKVTKYLLAPGGDYVRDRSYVGQDAWEDDPEPPESNLEKVTSEDTDFGEENKQELKKEPGLEAGLGKRQAAAKATWQERLAEWEYILAKEKWAEDIDALTSKYVISFDWQEIQKNFLKEQNEKRCNRQRYRGEWILKRWWQYRPKLPYTYFLQKVECLEVEAVVYSEDLKRVFVTMKEGFPSQYIVDIPVDPYLFELLTSCGVEVDTLHRSRFHYLLRALAVLAPGFLLLWLIERTLYTLCLTSTNVEYDILKSKYENLILPGDAEDSSVSGYKDVVLGGDVWDLLDEIMLYMKNPMKYYNKGVKLPRGILISGPPGTGKTLLARAIARESGLPFVFASGAEFAESGTKSGSEKIFDIFFTARANAPSFIFIDEIDALAGKHANDDPERSATFDQLLSQLDGEAEDTDVYRYSPRQAVILICATNRPEELDDRFILPGRIDREIHIGLPGEKERVKMFAVHSAGKHLAKDVNFQKLAFRTVGYSGADVRNLVNEAGIMAVRKGHDEIFQQDIIDVLDKQLFESMGLVLMEEEQQRYEKIVPLENKRLLAVHEAGHILLAHLFPRFDWHAFTHLLPGGQESALSVFYPREEMLQKGYATVGYLKMQMVVAHGGRCAEQIVFGDDVTDGGRDDLAKITHIAREIVISPANPRLGLLRLTWNGNFEAPAHFQEEDLIKNEWEKPGTVIAQMSVELSELFTREVTRYVDETEEQAKIALATNRHILDKLAAKLLEHTKLTGLEVEEIVKSMNPIMISDPLRMPDLNLDNMEITAPPNTRLRYDYLDIYPAPLHRC